MKKVAKTEQEERVSFIVPVLKGALMALSISLIGILIFAFILRFTSISDGAIKPINQAIKIVSIVLGTVWGLKKSKEMGLISGLIIGILYTIIAFVAFSILDGQFEFSRTIVNDLLFGSIIGAISGIIAVNFRKK